MISVIKKKNKGKEKRKGMKNLTGATITKEPNLTYKQYKKSTSPTKERCGWVGQKS